MGENNSAAPDLSEEHRVLWLNADKFLCAKKCVDSMLYIGDLIKPPKVNKLGACGVDISGRITCLRRTFYIECGNLLDKCLKKKEIKKRGACEGNSTINAIYYERDKNCAHADENYVAPTFSSLSEMAQVMKEQMSCVRQECANILPEVLEADYVCFDGFLARIVHGVSPEKELEALRAQHPFYIEPDSMCLLQDGSVFKNFADISQLQDVLKSPCDYCVSFQMKLFKEESLQSLQDSCVRVNVLYGYDVWLSPGPSFDTEYEAELKRVGLMDEFGKFLMPMTVPTSDVLQEQMRVMRACCKDVL